MPDDARSGKRKVLAPRRSGGKRGEVVPDLRDRTMSDIIRRLEDGEGMAAICRSDGMPSRETVRRWCEQDRALAERIYEARETGFMDRAEKAVEAAKTAKDAHLGRLAFDAERWYLGKLSIAFAERPPRVDSQTNVQVNIDGDPTFSRLAEFMDRAASAIAGGASSTQLVAGDGEAGPDRP